jgi:hypothetical protein
MAEVPPLPLGNLSLDSADQHDRCVGDQLKEHAMTVTLEQLEELRFAHTHDIVMNGDMPTFRRRQGPAPLRKASVYMWISARPDDPRVFDVMYVGKAGNGVTIRQAQHRSGFVNSPAGRANRRLITEWLATDRTLQVHARVSDTQAIFGSRTTLYSSEEAAACEVFEPRWNRAVFPRVLDEGAEQPADDIAANETEPAVTQEALAVGLIGEAFQDVPYGDEVIQFVGSLDANDRARFLRLMLFLQACAPHAMHKVVRGYTGQPAGYDKTPMLVLGNIRESDGRAVDWFARVPLVEPEGADVTVIFHRTLLADGVDAARVAFSDKGDWRPLDLDAFLDHPQGLLAAP